MVKQDLWQKALENTILNNIFKNAFIILSFLSISSYSQIKVKGTVTDSIGAVPFANILLKDHNNFIKQYAKSDESGFYSIQLKENKDDLILEVATINHETKTLALKNYSVSDNTLELNLKLNHRTTEIKEVLIVTKSPILTKKDTVEYNPESFKDGSERVVEDLLKKLPGISVENNGEIKFNGKTIKKMLLDGDDLFDANYTLGSKNINVDIIEKVQGIEHFDENSLLKGIRDSDEVALNLVLKKGKTDFSGNAILGYGIHERYYGNLSGVIVNKKMKGFGVASYNNIGQNNTPYDFDSEIISLENLRNRDINSKTLINEGNFNSAIDNSFHRINNNFYTSLNSLNKVYRNSKLKLNFGLYTDKLERFNQSNSTIFLENESFQINEINNLKKSPLLYDFKFQFSNKEKKNFHWEFIGKLNYNTVKFNDFSTNNSNNQHNIVKSESFNLNQQLNATYKISENKALISSVIYAKSKSPQSLFTNPGTVIDNSNNLIASKQNSEFVKDFFNVNTSYFISKNKFKYGLHSSFFKTENSLESILLDDTNQSLGIAFENNTNYKIDNFNINPVVAFNEEKFSIKLGANAIYNKISLKEISNSEDENNYFVTPKVNLIYRFSKKKSTSFEYTFNQILPEEDKVFSGIVQTSYRGFVSNSLSLEKLKTHSYNLNYKHNDFFNLTQYGVSLSYNYRPNNYFYSTIINQNITVNNLFYANISNKDYGLSFFGETYIHPLRTTFQINSNFNLSFNNNIINDSQTREIRNEALFLNFVARRKFKNDLLFENKITFLNNEVIIENENIKNNFQSLTNQTKLGYKVNDRFNANVIGNFISPNLKDSNNYFFLESEMNFTPKNKKVSFSLIGKNLTDNKVFQTRSVSDYSSTLSSHNLIKRYVMMKVTFGF